MAEGIFDQATAALVRAQQMQQEKAQAIAQEIAQRHAQAYQDWQQQHGMDQAAEQKREFDAQQDAQKQQTEAERADKNKTLETTTRKAAADHGAKTFQFLLGQGLSADAARTEAQKAVDDYLGTAGYGAQAGATSAPAAQNGTPTLDNILPGLQDAAMKGGVGYGDLYNTATQAGLSPQDAHTGAFHAAVVANGLNAARSAMQGYNGSQPMIDISPSAMDAAHPGLLGSPAAPGNGDNTPAGNPASPLSLESLLQGPGRSAPQQGAPQPFAPPAQMAPQAPVAAGQPADPYAGMLPGVAAKMRAAAAKEALTKAQTGLATERTLDAKTLTPWRVKNYASEIQTRKARTEIADRNATTGENREQDTQAYQNAQLQLRQTAQQLGQEWHQAQLNLQYLNLNQRGSIANQHAAIQVTKLYQDTQKNLNAVDKAIGATEDQISKYQRIYNGPRPDTTANPNAAQTWDQLHAPSPNGGTIYDERMEQLTQHNSLLHQSYGAFNSYLNGGQDENGNVLPGMQQYKDRFDQLNAPPRQPYQAPVLPAAPTVISPNGGVNTQRTGAAGRAGYSVPQIADMVRHAGFPDSAIPKMVGIILAESGGNPNNVTPEQPGGVSRGLAQIYGKAHPEYDHDGMLDPLENLKAAYKLSNGGRDFSAWTTASPTLKSGPNKGKPNPNYYGNQMARVKRELGIQSNAPQGRVVQKQAHPAANGDPYGDPADDPQSRIVYSAPGVIVSPARGK